MPAAVAAVAAWVVANAAVVAAVAAVVAAGYSYYQARKMAGQMGKNNPYEQKQMFRSPSAPLKVIYGEADVSGPIIYAEELGEPDDSGFGEALHLIVPLAGHPCDRVVQVFLGDVELQESPASAAAWGADQVFEHAYDKMVTENVLDEDGNVVIGPYGPVTQTVQRRFYHAWVAIYLGNHAQITTAENVNLESWQPDMVGRGLTVAHVCLYSNPEVWAAGVPNFHAVVRGKPVLDPRLGGYVAWSANPALAIRDYLADVLAIPASRIPTELLIAAANECDELVPVPGGGEEPRYRIGCAFDIDTAPDDVLAKMASTMGGGIYRNGGLWTIQAAAYYGPATFTITASDVMGDAILIPAASRKNRINTVTGQFIDPAQQFTVVDMPAVVDADALAADGRELSIDLDLEWIPSATQAQRIATVELRKSRFGRSLELTCKPRCFPAFRGRVVAINIPELGLTGHEFRVEDWSFDAGVVHLVLVEEHPDIWSNPSGLRTVTAPPLLSLPNPAATAPVTDFAWADAADDAESQGVLSWTHPHPLARFEVRILGGTGEVQFWPELRTSVLPLAGLIAGRGYTAIVRALNSFGMKGDETALQFTPQLPTTPTVWVKLASNGDLQIKVQRTSPGAGWLQDTGAPINVRGPSGEPLYTWLKYADDASGAGMSDSATGKAYIGIAHNKPTATESINPLDYTWSRLQGTAGDSVQQEFAVEAAGPWHFPYSEGDRYVRYRIGAGAWSAAIPLQGPPGDSLYTWVVYSDATDGSELIYATNAGDRAYRGLRYNEVQSAPNLTNASLYTWDKIRPEVGDVFSAEEQADFAALRAGTHPVTGEPLMEQTLAAIRAVVIELSAISANLGTVTGGLFRTGIAPAARAEMTSEAVSPYWFAAYATGEANPVWAVSKAGALVVKPGAITESMLDPGFTDRLLRLSAGGASSSTIKTVSGTSVANNATLALPAVSCDGSAATIAFQLVANNDQIGGSAPTAGAVRATLYRNGSVIASRDATSAVTSGLTPVGNPRFTAAWSLQWSFDDATPPAGSNVYTVVITHHGGAAGSGGWIYPATGEVPVFSVTQAAVAGGSLSVHWGGIEGKPALAGTDGYGVVVPAGLNGGTGAHVKSQASDGQIEAWLTSRLSTVPGHLGIGIRESVGPVYWDGTARRRLWHEGNDGPGSGMDADTLDGLQAAAFAQLSGAAFSGPVTSEGGVSGRRLATGADYGIDFSVMCTNWFRSVGATGWYNQTYGGGLHMSDGTWIRTYGGKKFHVDNAERDAVLISGGFESWSTKAFNYAGKCAIGGMNDTWLRLNPDAEFTSGIYAGTGIFRTDGELQVGPSGAHFRATSAGAQARSHITGGLSNVMTWADFRPNMGPPPGLESTITTNWLAAGAVTANIIAAYSINASHLTISDFTNIITNGLGQSLAGWHDGAGGAPQMSAQATDLFGTGYIFNVWGRDHVFGSPFPVTAGDQFFCSFSSVPYGGGVGNFAIQLGLQVFNGAGQTILWTGAAVRPAGVAGVQVSNGVATIPAGAASARVWFQINTLGSSQAAGDAYHTSRLEMYRRNNGNLIVDGAITANKIAAGTITGDKIQAGTSITAPVLRGGRAEMVGANAMRVTSALAFGPDSLITWFGPKSGLVDASGNPVLSLLTKANATTWEDGNGNAYFGGQLSAGTLSSAGTFNLSSSNWNATDWISVLHANSNGRSKTVIVSATVYHGAEHLGTGTGREYPGNVTASYPARTATFRFRLYRGTTVIATWTRSATSTATFFPYVPGDPWPPSSPGSTVVEHRFSLGSQTITDTSALAGDVEYRLVIDVQSGTHYAIGAGRASIRITEV